MPFLASRASQGYRRGLTWRGSGELCLGGRSLAKMGLAYLASIEAASTSTSMTWKRS